jgi:hypothetical protein
MKNTLSAGMLYACKGAHHRDRTYLYGAHTLFTNQREKERARERERERERVSEKEGEREREKERKRERC